MHVRDTCTIPPQKTSLQVKLLLWVRFLNQHPAVVLFDSGASHSFTSQIFASKHDQRVVTIDKDGYCISVARNNISTSQIVRDVRISISNREYTSDLVVLLGLGIDVILGMKWISGHGVLIDTLTRTNMLREPQSNNAFLVPLPRSFDLQNLACAIQTMTLLDILVVCEFLDVFLDELPRLPPDRDVEFKIEFLPGTIPISQRPYRMPPNKLAELKVQLQELLEKCLIRPSSSLWGCPTLFVKKKDKSLWMCVNY